MHRGSEPGITLLPQRLKLAQRRPEATECSRDLFGYEVVEGRHVVAAFDGGEVTSDAGALLLGATDRAIGLVTRFAACFDDGRDQAQIEHQVEAMVAQRVLGIALGMKTLTTTTSCATTRCWRCWPANSPRSAGLRAARRQEHAQPSRACAFRPDPNKIGHDAAAIGGLFVTLFLEAHKTPPPQITLGLDATDDPLHGHPPSLPSNQSY